MFKIQTKIMRPLLAARLSFALLLCASAHVAATPITLPPGFSPDTPYRLAFVTAGLTPASSHDIAHYNSFVTGEALASAPLAALDTGWRVIGSTQSVDAKTNTATDPTLDVSVPIYNLAGLMIASDYADLWDGGLLNPINVDQYGATWAQKVFTGTATDGGGIANRELGGPNGFRVQFGESGLTDTGWTSIDWAGTLTGLHYYAISDVLGQQASAVPEPGTFVLLGAGLIGFLGARAGRKG